MEPRTTTDFVPQHHFRGVRKMVGIERGMTRFVDDFMALRYACRLIS